MRVTWKCPYCGFENDMGFVEDDVRQPKFVYCVGGEGGCDEMVAVWPAFMTSVSVYKLEPVFNREDEEKA
jgi:hypothetical protein